MKQGSVPERALLHARATCVICLSSAVEAEIREVFRRPKFSKYLAPDRIPYVSDMVIAGAMRFEPLVEVTDCRDLRDNKYLELALAARADVIVSSDRDLLDLHPWRGIQVLTPAEFLEQAGVGGA